MAVFTPSVRVAFDEPGTSQKFNQAAENTDYLFEKVDSGQVNDSAELGGVAAASYLQKSDAITGTVSVNSGTSGAYSGYITHNRGTQYPCVTLVSTANPALFQYLGSWGIEFTDTNRLRIWVAGNNGTQNIRFIIR